MIKKLLQIGLVSVLLVGCNSKGQNAVAESVYTRASESQEFNMETVEILTSKGDVVMHEKVVTTYTFLDVSEEDISALKSDIDSEINCPFGTVDENGNKTIGCSEFITISYTEDEATNTMVITVDYNYEEASNAGKLVFPKEGSGYLEDGESRSLKEYADYLLRNGFKLKK